jgi:hypothetical protein
VCGRVIPISGQWLTPNIAGAFDHNQHADLSRQQSKPGRKNLTTRANEPFAVRQLAVVYRRYGSIVLKN